jgi:hypothetical protein
MEVNETGMRPAVWDRGQRLEGKYTYCNIYSIDVAITIVRNDSKESKQCWGVVMWA